jgi:hypothetical protein
MASQYLSDAGAALLVFASKPLPGLMQTVERLLLSIHLFVLPQLPPGLTSPNPRLRILHCV